MYEEVSDERGGYILSAALNPLPKEDPYLSPVNISTSPHYAPIEREPSDLLELYTDAGQSIAQEGGYETVSNGSQSVDQKEVHYTGY